MHIMYLNSFYSALQSCLFALRKWKSDNSQNAKNSIQLNINKQCPPSVLSCRYLSFLVQLFNCSYHLKQHQRLFIIDNVKVPNYD